MVLSAPQRVSPRVHRMLDMATSAEYRMIFIHYRYTGSKRCRKLGTQHNSRQKKLQQIVTVHIHLGLLSNIITKEVVRVALIYSATHIQNGLAL